LKQNYFTKRVKLAFATVRSITAITLALALCLAPISTYAQGEDPYYDPLETISDIPQPSDDEINIRETLRQQEEARIIHENFYQESLAWFDEHGFTAWAEFTAPFEHYGDAPQPLRYTPSEYYTTSQNTIYSMGNQPPYKVQLGPVAFNFNGAVVQMTEGAMTTGGSCDGLSNSLNGYSGWSNDIVTEPQSGNVYYHHAWLKGYLTRHVVEIQTGSPDSCGLRTGTYVYRYQYHAPNGSIIRFYQRPGEVGSTSTWSIGPCNTRTQIPGPEPTSYWSDDGSASLDTTNACKPKIRWADGSLETFHAADTVEFPVNQNGDVSHWADAEASCGQLGDRHITDHNGNLTTFQYTSNSESMIDAKGRITTVTFDLSSATFGFARLKTVDVTAAGGGTPLRYTINWKPTPFNVNFASIWPDVHCHSSTGAIGGGVIPCGSSPIELVDSINIPDGRSYQFSYTPWAALDTVVEPGGAVRKYGYGDATNTIYAQNTLPLINRVDSTLLCGPIWTSEMPKVQARGVISESVYPQGLSGPANVTRISYEKVDLGGCSPNVIGAATAGPDACTQVWKVITNPDLSVKKTGTAVRALPFFVNRPPLNSGPVSPHGWVIGEEIWNAGATQLLAATYEGDKTTGDLDYLFETAATLRMQIAAVVDRRIRKVVSLKQGVMSTTIFNYDDTIDIDPGTSVVSRNTGNITEQRTWLGDKFTGTLLTQTDSTYFHPTNYLDQNILHLPASKTLTDPARGVLTRIDYGYDEYGLTSSGAPNLDTTVGPARGNVTTVTTYRQPATLSGAASSHKNYFDTGDLRQSIDANGNPTTMTYDFVPCSTSHTLSTSSVSNAKGHQTTTVSDCFSGQPLRVTDPNNNSMFTQYDVLGRVLETAGPGDTLTPIPGLIRDPGAPLNGGSLIGNNGQGPTTWTDYLSLGVINQQRTVVHTKDGTANGRYVKTLTDGLGRTIQTRAEVDPSTSGGNGEVVGTTVYDNMGRVSTTYVPCFSSVNDVVTSPCTSQSTITAYDELGRVTSVRLPGLATPTTTIYSASTTEQIATTTDLNGNHSQSFTDVLGRVVRTARESANCTGGWCTTLMVYDAAGRLLQTTDPGGNILLIAYDGLGRKTEMTDPDMGHWTYDYDNNGNLTRQVDAKGQLIQMSYDVLNRLKVKDLPPNSSIAGAEDTTYFYDGDQAP